MEPNILSNLAKKMISKECQCVDKLHTLNIHNIENMDSYLEEEHEKLYKAYKRGSQQAKDYDIFYRDYDSFKINVDSYFRFHRDYMKVDVEKLNDIEIYSLRCCEAFTLAYQACRKIRNREEELKNE